MLSGNSSPRGCFILERWWLAINRLRELREENGLSLQNLKEELEKKDTHVARSSLSKYENGSQNPKQAVWEKLASYFDVDVAYIMGLSTKKRSIDERLQEDEIIISKREYEELIRIKKLAKQFTKDFRY